MTRRNFSRDVRVEIIKRATIDGVLRCEKPDCGCIAKSGDVHHLVMDAMETDKSRKLTAAEGQFWCRPCHKEETKAQAAILAKAKAREASHAGVRTRPVQKMRSAPSVKSERTANRQPRAQVSGPPGMARRFQEDRR